MHLIHCSNLWSPMLRRFVRVVLFSELSLGDLLGLSARLGGHRFLVPVAATFAQHKAHMGLRPMEAIQAGCFLAASGRPKRPAVAE